MPVQPMGQQIVRLNRFTWIITNFTKLTENKYYSVSFRIGKVNWRILLYPKGNNTDHLSLYLVVADSANLPYGWTRFAEYSLAVVNQRNTDSSVKKEGSRNFCASDSGWGFPRVVGLSELCDDGFLVEDTLIVEARVNVPEVAAEERLADTSTGILDSDFSRFELFISAINDVCACCMRSPSDARCPTLDEVENAKRSLKECLSGMFKLDIKDRLAEALSTLSSANVGLSAGQSSSARAFWANYGDFTADFLTFTKDNAEFELHKLMKDEMFIEMKKCLETNILFEKFSEEIAKEEEECKRKMEESTKDEEACKTKMEEIRSKKEKLESDWEVLVAESKEAAYKYVEHERKAKDAEEKKRIAEERMSRSTTAWSNLKAEFA